MRGKAISSKNGRGQIRITPAYAGKSAMDGIDGKTSGDHPRLCGEKHGQPHIAPDQKGSPPPMRGKAAAGGLCHKA